MSQFPLIPKQAFLFFPVANQLLQIRSGQEQRIIFDGGLDFTSNQKKKLLALTKAIGADEKSKHLSEFPESLLLRFHQANSFKIPQTIVSLQEYKKWQKTVSPLVFHEKISKSLAEGFVYFSGRDCKFRPILVINVGKMIAKKMKTDHMKEMLGFFLTYLIQNCLIEGQVETWVGLIDLGNCGVFSVGGALKDAIGFLSSCFRARVHHNYLVNCPSSIKIVWGMAKGSLNEDQQRKITLTCESELPTEAFKQINSSQVERQYGGDKPNINSYWPIKAPEGDLTVTGTNVPLISEKEYTDLYQKGKLAQRKVNMSLISMPDPIESSPLKFSPIEPSPLELSPRKNEILPAQGIPKMQNQRNTRKEDIPPKFKLPPTPLKYEY